MAEAIRTLSIKLDFKGSGTQAIIDKIKSSFKGLEQVIQGNTKPAIQKLRNEINTFASTGNKSISTIESQVTALRALRREADINSTEFKQLTADITKFEKQLEKAQGRRPRGGGRALAATQIAGAVVSGGIFGGPEGALGALGGAALGGVPGAFAGAAIGAQVGGIRQTLGEFADYAAQIARLEIALEGIAGSQDEFNQALAAARDVTKGLNVPQEVAIQGITRLTAAVKGAGGGVADAELAFRNINSAIIATGGGSEEVQGAVTALVQIFSKGKVSAEEINQIAERLPGTFNKIAEASGRTGPELTKALQKGQVGLNDLTKFLVSLGDEYGDLASTIANSSENAGARLQIAFNNLRVEVGDALQPVGAEFQDAFKDFVEDITPALVVILPQIGKLALVLTKNIDILAGSIAGLAAAMVAVNFKKFVAGIASIKAAATGAKFAALLLNPWVALAAGIGAAVVALSRYKREAVNVASAVELGNEASRVTAFKTLSNTSARISLLSKEIQELQDLGKNRDARRKQRQLNVLRRDRDVLKEALQRTQPTVKADISDLTEFDDPKPDGTGGKIKDISDEQLAKALAELNARQKIATLDKESIELKRAQFVAQRDTAIAAAKAANAAKGGLEPNKETLAINKANATFTAQNLQLDKQIEAQAEKNLRAKQQEEELILRGRLMAGEITQEQFNQEQTLQSISELLELQPELYDKIKKKLEEAATPLGKFKDGVRKIFEEAMNLNEALATAGVQAVQQFGDAFADFVATGKASFADLTKSILQDLSRIFAKAALFKALSFIPGVGGFLGLGGGGGGGGGGGSSNSFAGVPNNILDSVLAVNAKGNIYAKNKIVPFAYGGIVNKPTIFPMAKGAGLMAESGPEAIMPLRRGRNGKLGVEASGGVGNVVVNVDASGSRVQGDQPNAKALGSAIGAAVQAELIKQKRPGGLLS